MKSHDESLEPSNIGADISYQANCKMYQDGVSHIRDIIDDSSKYVIESKPKKKHHLPRRLPKGLKQLLEEQVEKDVLRTLSEINNKLDKVVTILSHKHPA